MPPLAAAMLDLRRFLLRLAAVAGSALVAPAQGDPAAQAAADLATLSTEWRAAQTAFRDESIKVFGSPEYLAALAAGDNDRLRALRDALPAPDAAAFGRRALALASKHDDHGGAFVVFAAQQFASVPAVATEAADLLGGRYVMDPAIVRFLEHPTALLAMLDWDAGLTLLGRIEEAHEGAIAAAWAKYWLALSLVTSRRANEGSPRVVGLLADAERLAAGTMLAERIAAPRFERERLQVGMTVPDIVGVDMDGQPMQLSALRGKVVVLVFWSFGVTAERTILAVQSQLVERHKDKPMVLVGVNGDTNKAHYERGLKLHGVTWRSFTDGGNGQSGPIATRWNVRSWPTFFVIDHEGLIQFRGGDEVAVEKVLAPLILAADKAAATAAR